MVPVAEDEPFGDPRLGLSSNMLRVHHPYGEPTQPYRRQEPPRGTGTAGDMAGAPTGLPLGPALRPWPEDTPSHLAPQSPMLQPWQQQQHQQQQQQQQHLQQQLQQQQQVIDALCAQVSLRAQQGAAGRNRVLDRRQRWARARGSWHRRCTPLR